MNEEKRYGAYKKKQFMARMNYATYLRLRRLFLAFPGESANSYFYRLSKYLENDDSVIVDNLRRSNGNRI